MSDRVSNLREKVYREDGGPIVAVLDGASVPGLLQKLVDLEPEYLCLYRGELKPDLAEVAPYVVRLERESPLAEWIFDRGWGNHWGIFAETGADFVSLRKHFRRYLTVHDPGGKPMLFRYYDPRVLRVYLPSCNGEELKSIFGPVDAYLVEDESGAALLRFTLKNGALAKQAENLP